MTVTAIVPLDKKRDRIFLEGEFAFVLYKGEQTSYHIKENSELSELYYQEIMTRLLPRRAKLRAMKLLTARSYTESKLRDKLAAGLYPEDIVEEAIAYVKSYGYIDDASYAAEYISYHAEQMSKRQMEQKLMQRGISREVIRSALMSFCESEGEIDETAQIHRFLARENYDSRRFDEKERQRLAGMLYRKGYKTDNIFRAMDSFT